MTPTQTGDKPMVTCPPCPICKADATWETALTANVGGKEIVYGSCSECSCTAEYHDWNTRAQETLSPEQPLDTIQRLGQEFDAPEASPSLGMGEAHGDRKCDACHRDNPVWFAPSPLWNLVIGGPEATDDPGGVLCPICFIEKAEAAGIMPATGAWLVTKEPAASLSPPSPDLAEENERLAEAARNMCFNFLLDERDNESFCVGPDHHKAICDLFEALEARDATLQSISTGGRGATA